MRRKIAIPSNSEYLDTKGAGQFIGMPHRTLETWRLNRKGPPYFKLGEGIATRVLYSKADLLKWMESKRVIPDE